MHRVGLVYHTRLLILGLLSLVLNLKNVCDI